MYSNETMSSRVIEEERSSNEMMEPNGIKLNASIIMMIKNRSTPFHHFLLCYHILKFIKLENELLLIEIYTNKFLPYM